MVLGILADWIDFEPAIKLVMFYVGLVSKSVNVAYGLRTSE